MRLLSLAPSNTEILFALGVGDELVGITNLCDFPKETNKIQKLGSWIYTEPKKILELAPDIIFTSYFMPESLRNWKGPGKIIHVEPKTLDEVYQSIKYIAKVVQRSREAKDIVEKMKSDILRVRQNAESRSSRLASARSNNKIKIYAEEWPKPPMASGNWVPELISIAGGTAGLSEQGKPSSTYDFADLVKFDPDVLLFHWCGYKERFNKESVLKRPGWKELRAVKENKLFVIDDSLLNRPGPRLVEGAKRIQQILLQI